MFVMQRRVFVAIDNFAIVQDDKYKEGSLWLNDTCHSGEANIFRPEPSQIIFITDAMHFHLSSLLRWTALSSVFFSSGSQAFGPSFIEGGAIALIRNNLNLYSRLQDTKNFAALNQVFTQDASPVGLAGPSDFPNNLTGIEEFLTRSLEKFTTLHYSDTQYVQLDPSGHTATAVSYGQAVYFGENAAVTGQICTFYETFTDEFVLQSGTWLSKNKTLQVYAITGNTSIVFPGGIPGSTPR